MKKAKKSISSQDVRKVGYGAIKGGVGSVAKQSGGYTSKKQSTPKTSSGSMKKTVTPRTTVGTISKNQGSGLAKKVTGNTKPQTTNKFKKTQTSRTAPTKQNAQRKKLY